MIIVVLFATANAGGRGLEVLISGIGAVGQVFFAWMVWRLGTKQFEFAKSVAKRQARIDTLGHRREVFSRYRTLQRSISYPQLDEANAAAFGEIAVDVEQLFSDEAIARANQLSVHLWTAVDLKEEIEEAEVNGESTADLVARRPQAIRAIREAKTKFHKALAEELRLRID